MKNKYQLFVVIIILLVCVFNNNIFRVQKNQEEEIVEPAEPIIEEEVVEEDIPEEEPEEEEPVALHVSFKTEGDGYNVYSPTNMGYRYGPSIIYYEDGTKDAWFSHQGNGRQWDWISYKHYDGENWGSEQIVLKPTDGGNDAYSVCDPGVIYFDGYYFIAYTSTLNSEGIENCLYVARSENPDGPFEKWNGNGWGGDPYPIVEYKGDPGYWGIGEGSFVVVGDKIYLYYTDVSQEGEYTKVRVGDVCENWPDSLSHSEICYARTEAQDSCDVVYLDYYDMFIAVSSIHRFTENSGICVLESYDGITFTMTDIVKKGISRYCHNVGIAKRSNGHINIEDELMIGYAYGTSSKSWGRWATRFQEISLFAYPGDINLPSSHEDNTFRELIER
ncbi:MAG: hypothetical protein Q4E33_03245 [Erysipelotrichaceae bacterium]|nr:hypothetical protein [Erysipelotrichaceae bacterium]